MNTYIALLKGINVGGHKKVPMAELRELLTRIGFMNVRTYIQSGNVILESDIKDNTEIEGKIEKAIFTKFEFQINVLVKTREQLKYIFDNCPFTEDKKKTSYFMMLHTVPDRELVKIASEKMYEGEEYLIIEGCIYYFPTMGYGKSKFNVNFFERKLQTFATARNYNTMVKLLSLSAEN